MIKLEKTEVFGFKHAVRGMRNPKNSWDKSDSFICCKDGLPICMQQVDPFSAIVDEPLCPFDGHCPITDDEDHFIFGKNDLKLAKTLRDGGPVHAKYRRMITVYVDITAPLYWWKEFDTYKIGTVANSCSTMHKIHAKEFTLDDFSHDHLTEFVPGQKLNGWALEDNDLISLPNDPDYGYSSIGILKDIIIKALNFNRKKYLETKDKKYWWQMIQLLPTSYNQKRTVMLNYEVLAGIYPMRKDHKLDEWHTFCDWIKSLPYSELIIGDDE